MRLLSAARIVAAGIGPVIALCFVVWHWVFFVTELGPPPSFLLCHHHGCNRAEDGNKEPDPRVKAKSEELCWLWHRHESLGASVTDGN
jgi:hypothetical protein